MTKATCTMIQRKSIVVLLLLGCVFGIFYTSLRTVYQDVKAAPASDDAITSYMKNNTPKNSDVLLVGFSSYKYLWADRYTKNKFFYQFPPVQVSEKIFNEFISELKSKTSDYIIFCRNIPTLENMKNFQNTLDYLNGECDKGNYKLEKYDGFQVYVKK